MNLKRILIAALALALGLFVTTSVSAQEEYEFIVIRKQAARIRVAVPDFLTLSDFPRGDATPLALTRQFREAVRMTGLFELVPPEAYPGAPLTRKREDMSAWKLINTDLLIRGDVAYLNGEDYQVEIRCFDTLDGEMVLGKRYTVKPDMFNRMIYRYIDQLLERYNPTNGRGALEAKIAYVTDARGRGDVHVMDTDGSHDQPITTDHLLNQYPVWSRDGRYLLYQAFKRRRNPDLYIMDLETGRETRFFGGQGLHIPGEWSPDDRWIAFTRELSDGNIDVFLINVRSKELRRVTTHPANDLSPTFSPDGKFLAFVSDRTGSPQIYLLDLARGAESDHNSAVRLTMEGSYNAWPAWSPDGRYIAYNGRVGGQFDLFLIDVSGRGNPVKRLTATTANEEHPSWSPDSRFLVYDSNKYGNYDIYIMSIYGGEPRRITTGKAKEIMPAWSNRLQQP